MTTLSAAPESASGTPEDAARHPAGDRDTGASGMDFISWHAVRQVAVRVARPDRWGPEDARAMEEDLAELVPLAEDLVSELTGLVPAWGPARPVVVGRAGWVAANIDSFERLLTPIVARLPVPNGRLSSLPGASAVLSGVGKAVTGAELGTLLGWMSGRVLGQYDLIFAGPDGAIPEDAVYFVGPNIAAIERRYGFPPRQFRLWIALHELTHRAQFTGVPWMRAHFMSLVHEALETSLPDPDQLSAALKKAVSSLRSRTNPLDNDAGILGLFMGDDARAVFDKVQGMMSFLEGHGDTVMDRAGSDHIPLASHFSRVLSERRKSASRPARLVMQLVGLDAKIRQYANGEAFVAYIEEAGGAELLARVWQGPEYLPSSTEIREPARWVERVSAGAGRAERESEQEIEPDDVPGSAGGGGEAGTAERRERLR